MIVYLINIKYQHTKMSPVHVFGMPEWTMIRQKMSV